MNINEDKAQADKEMREFIEGYYNMPFETMSRTQSVFTGNVQDATGWLKGFIDAGAQTMVIRFGGPNQAGQLELCGKEVIPQLRGLHLAAKQQGYRKTLIDIQTPKDIVGRKARQLLNLGHDK